MIQRAWWPRWVATRWGYAYHTCVLWAARGNVGPEETLRQWNTDTEKMVDVIVIYRELILSDASESAIARRIVELTPKEERKQLVRHVMTPPDTFGGDTSRNTIAEQMGPLLKLANIPLPERADEDVVGGWRLVHNSLRRAKLLAESESLTPEQITEGPCLFISATCEKLREAMPTFIRHQKDSELIAMEKRDASSFDDTSQACGEALRVLCKSMVFPRAEAPAAIRRREAWDSQTDPNAKAMALRLFDAREKEKRRITRGKRWR